MPENTTPNVFVSAVSSDLRNARKVVNESLNRIGCLPVEQSISGTEYGKVRDMIQRRIEECHAVVHLVGRDYGGEPNPKNLPEGQPRRSWTQIEYDIARQLKKRLYLFICDDQFPFALATDPPSDEKHGLQQAHRQAVVSENDLWYRILNEEELRRKIENLKVGLELVRDELQQEQLEIQHERKRVFETLSEFATPGVLAERIRREIRITADKQIKDLPEDSGRWKSLAEIENQRDIALKRVDNLCKLIEEQLKEGASLVFQRAAEILQKEGTDAALAYLGSRRASTLETARLHAAQAKAAQLHADAEKEERNKSLQGLVLEAELLQTKLQWEPLLKLREELVELAPDWFAARNCLGMLLVTLSRFADAEPHFRANLKLAATPAEESIALTNLAYLLQETNQLKDAESLMHQSLAVAKKFYGAEQPEVTVRLRHLAGLFLRTNRSAEAERLLRQALAIDEKSERTELTDIGFDLNDLGALLLAADRLDEAEPLMRRALTIDEQLYGTEHPEVAIRLNGLANLLQATHRLEGAELLACRALAIAETYYGAHHLEVATPLNTLAELFYATNRRTEAEAMLRRALVIDERYYGPEHPDLAIRLYNLAMVLESTDRLQEAEPLMHHSIAIFYRFKLNSGHEHPDMKASLSSYLDMLRSLNYSPVEIEQRLEEAKAIEGPLELIEPVVEQLLGPAQPTSEVLAAMDRDYKQEGKPAIYFLTLAQPIAPYLDELLGPVSPCSSDME